MLFGSNLVFGRFSVQYDLGMWVVLLGSVLISCGEILLSFFF